MDMLIRLICLVGGYGVGLIQTAYIYGKLKGVDIRKYGSGNSGTTNALRVLGKKAGLIVFLGDFLKGIIACSLTYHTWTAWCGKCLYVRSIYRTWCCTWT